MVFDIYVERVNRTTYVCVNFRTIDTTHRHGSPNLNSTFANVTFWVFSKWIPCALCCKFPAHLVNNQPFKSSNANHGRDGKYDSLTSDGVLQ